MPQPFDYSRFFRQTGMTGLADLGNTLDGRSIYDVPSPQPGNPYNGLYTVPGLLPDSPISPARIRGLLSAFDDDDDDGNGKSKTRNLLSLGSGLLAASIPKPAPPMVLDAPAAQVHRPEAQPIAPVDFRAMPAVPTLPIAVPRKRRPILPAA
jgi:hypothetical protein